MKDYLNSLQNKGVKLGLDRIEKVLPKICYKVIHVAGTNGKGSVCAMLSSILIEAGYKVGLFTSPHLVKVNERIKINDKEITDEDFGLLVSKIKEISSELTYFEFLTMMAFVYFNEQEVDFAILEVGMGGRLDATNVVNADIAVITSISLEHTKQLGDNVVDIAKEKAAIIDGTCVTGVEDEDVLEVIREKSLEMIVAKESDFPSNLIGNFQKKNIGVVVEVVRKLGISEDVIKKGLLKVKLNGRFDFVKHNLLLDCAHNPGAMIKLVKELENIQYRKLILVIGFLDKDYRQMLKTIVPFASKVFVVKPKSERASEPKIVAKEIDKDKEIVMDVNEAVGKAFTLAQKNDLILVTGSMYLVGEVLDKFPQNI